MSLPNSGFGFSLAQEAQAKVQSNNATQLSNTIKLLRVSLSSIDLQARSFLSS
jgi:hypothetical protein